MHDPQVVAFEIRRPWPTRVNWSTRRWYFPPVITVWHVEPGGRDSGEVCKHYDRGRVTNGWRLHVHHWRLQVIPLQELRHCYVDWGDGGPALVAEAELMETRS